MCVCVWVCVCGCKKNPKTFVYINYSVCIDVCETKIQKKKKDEMPKIGFKKTFRKRFRGRRIQWEIINRDIFSEF